MKILTVEFKEPVSCGGSIKTASADSVVGDRPGQTPFRISLVDDFIRLEKKTASKIIVKYVPMSNVSSLGIDEDEPKPVEAKVAKK